jgi:hypothetical protein
MSKLIRTVIGAGRGKDREKTVPAILEGCGTKPEALI